MLLATNQITKYESKIHKKCSDVAVNHSQNVRTIIFQHFDQIFVPTMQMIMIKESRSIIINKSFSPPSYRERLRKIQREN